MVVTLCGLALAACGGMGTHTGPGADGGDGEVTPGDSSTPGTPVTIAFDDLADADPVTTQYARYVTFSSDPGATIYTMVGADGFGSSPPNFICATYECDASTFLAFTHPASQLRFDAIGVNDTGTVASVKVFVGGALAATVPVIGEGDDTVPVHVDLSSYTNVTRLEIVDITDSAGIGLDDFAFVAP